VRVRREVREKEGCAMGEQGLVSRNGETMPGKSEQSKEVQ